MAIAQLSILGSQMAFSGDNVNVDIGLTFFLSYTDFGSVWVQGAGSTEAGQAILLGET
jgi:hypothetical protein